MEDDLKILKFEYLNNHWFDLPQILNLSSGDQTKIKNAQHETKELPQILNLSSGDQTKIKNAQHETKEE